MGAGACTDCIPCGCIPDSMKEDPAVLAYRGRRVKCIDIHPTEPWVLVSFWRGRVLIYNYQTEELVREWEIFANDPQPSGQKKVMYNPAAVRTAKFIPSKKWVICGADDYKLRVFSYVTGEEIKKWEAHLDYIRVISVHPAESQVSYALTCSDDQSIKLWDWEQDWKCIQIFMGHQHYVMSVAFHPHDPNVFASCSLDQQIKVWSLTSEHASFTLTGHEKGLNSIAWSPHSDKNYLISCADDMTAKIWDTDKQQCVQTLTGHTRWVTSAMYHPRLPIIITAAEDCSVRLYDANNYTFLKSYGLGLERIWCMACARGLDDIYVGGDEGCSMVKLDRVPPYITDVHRLSDGWTPAEPNTDLADDASISIAETQKMLQNSSF